MVFRLCTMTSGRPQGCNQLEPSVRRRWGAGALRSARQSSAEPRLPAAVRSLPHPGTTSPPVGPLRRVPLRVLAHSTHPSRRAAPGRLPPASTPITVTLATHLGRNAAPSHVRLPRTPPPSIRPSGRKTPRQPGRTESGRGPAPAAHAPIARNPSEREDRDARQASTDRKSMDVKPTAARQGAYVLTLRVPRTEQRNGWRATACRSRGAELRTRRRPWIGEARW